MFDSCFAGPLSKGGGAFSDCSSPVFVSCVFRYNRAGGGGGGGGGFAGVCEGAIPNYPMFDACTFIGNECEANSQGGGALFASSWPTLTNCTFYANSHPHSEGVSGIFFRGTGTANLQNVIISFGENGCGIGCAYEGYDLQLTCCDIYGNEGGDWWTLNPLTGCIEGQFGNDGNIREDPLFCAPEDGDLRLDSESRCAPDNAPPGCGLIGAHGVGCGPAGVGVPERDRRAAPCLWLDPNPFAGATRIHYRVQRKVVGAASALAIYDAAGRRVRSLLDPMPSGATGTAEWNGTDARGSEVPSGVYVLELRTEREALTRRLILIR